MQASRILILLLLVIAGLYAFRLNEPAEMYYDEVYHVKTAREFLTLSGNTDNSHPPFGKMLIALSMKLLGDKPWVWRLPSLLAGLASLYVFYLLALRIFRESSWALLAMLLLALDGISITQSRIAMLNTLMFLFMLLTTLFFTRFLENRKSPTKDLLLSGIFLGFAVGTRWVGVLIAPVLLILFFYPPTQKYGKSAFCFGEMFSFLRRTDRAEARRAKAGSSELHYRPQLSLKRVLIFVLSSVLIYFLIHCFLILIKTYDWKDPFWSYQINMFKYHSQLKAEHTYGSAWWGWLLMIRPIWYYFQRKEELIHGVICIGNPAIFWMFFIASGYLIWSYLKNRSAKIMFVLVGLLTQWLPWAVIGRVKFFHYVYPATPFLVLAVVLYLQAMWEIGRTGRIFVGFYLLLVIAMFIYWYPLYTSLPIHEAFFQNHLWFKSWV